MTTVLPDVLDPRRKSLLRANVVVWVSFLLAVALSGFPHTRQNPLLAIPAFTSVLGTADTIRCIRRRWSFYHGGVILCIYMDLMAVAMILFFFLYPYMHWLTSSR